jgi:hypothetical protein
MMIFSGEPRASVVAMAPPMPLAAAPVMINVRPSIQDVRGFILVRRAVS